MYMADYHGQTISYDDMNQVMGILLTLLLHMFGSSVGLNEGHDSWTHLHLEKGLEGAFALGNIFYHQRNTHSHWEDF